VPLDVVERPKDLLRRPRIEILRHEPQAAAPVFVHESVEARARILGSGFHDYHDSR
jgi:hypothetical protein